MAENGMISDVFCYGNDRNRQDGQHFWTEIEVKTLEGSSLKGKDEARQLKPSRFQNWGKIDHTKGNGDQVAPYNGDEEGNDFHKALTVGIDKGCDEEGDDGYQHLLPVTISDKACIGDCRVGQAKPDDDNHRSDDNGRQKGINPLGTDYLDQARNEDIDEADEENPCLGS